MPSLKAYLVSWYVWFNFKGSFQTAEGLHRRIKEERKKQDHSPHQHLQRQLIIEERKVGGCVVYDVAPKSETTNQARILYLHGGAFVFEIKPPHWELIAALAERLQAVVTVPIYPLAPEHSLLETYAMLQPLHDDMAVPSRDNTPFLIAGDSAGGTLALGLSQQALRANRPVASRLVLITPCVDSTFKNPEVHAMAKTDPWLDIPGLEEIGRLVCPPKSDLDSDTDSNSDSDTDSDFDPDSKFSVADPRLSPINGELDRLPPMMVFLASLDSLTPDIKRFVTMAKAKNRQVEAIWGEGMMHVWPVLPVPEAAEAVDRIVQWLREAKS